MDGNGAVEWSSVSQFAVDPRGRWLSILLDRPERNSNTISFKADKKTVAELADAIRSVIREKEASKRHASYVAAPVPPPSPQT